MVLPHPPYSPDLAPPDFHLFGSLKDALRGNHFEDDNRETETVRSGYAGRTRAGTSKEYMRLFHTDIRPYKLMETM
jgi:histone-lysine N-methyltransferase SETMAR